MYLKKITANGFKSFADKVSITFNKNQISGIIGPNGSGKSNVIDAVRWVMGEQNTKLLRGEKATDIIFAGSQKRKSLGMAEVTLTFDNSDPGEFCPPEFRHEQEISLTRRIYIDGQREYLLGGRPCRLKDIVSFFTSSGLGGRSYSMIQQGQVERILQAKPEEIREILEEAAGTGIFKVRRQESYAKLEQTRANLSRVDDILQEVNRQIESLQQQVRNAEKWQEYSSRLREDEISLFAHNYQHFRENELQLSADLATALDQEREAGTQLAELDEQYRLTKLKLEKADPQLQQLFEEIARIREEIASLEAALAAGEHLAEHSEQQVQALVQEIQEEEEHFRLNEGGQHGGVEENLAVLEAEVSNLAAIVQDFQQRLDLLDEEKIVFTNRAEEIADEQIAIEKSLTRNQIQQESVQRDFSKVSRQKAEYLSRLEQIEQENAQANILADSFQLQWQQRQGGLDHELSAKNKLELSLARKNEALQQGETFLALSSEQQMALKAQLAALRADEVSADEGIALWRKCASLLGSEETPHYRYLAECLSFTPGFTALPTNLTRACEQWLERVVCSEWSQLERLSLLLKDQPWGGLDAGLIESSTNLESVQVWAKKQRLTALAPLLVDNEGNSPQALDLSPLLGRLFAAPQHAGDLARLSEEIPLGAVVFTASGDTLYSTDHIIISVRGRDGLLTRKQRLAQLSEESELIQLEQARNIAIVENLREETAGLREELKNLDGQIQQINREVVASMAAYHGAQHKVENKREQLIAARGEMQKLVRAGEDCAVELQELQGAKLSLNEQLAQAAIAAEEAEQEALHLGDDYEGVKQQWESQKMLWMGARAKEQTLRDHAEQERLKVANFEQRMARKREKQQSLKEKIVQLGEQQISRQSDIKRLIILREESEERLNQKKEANASLVEEVRGLENRQKNTRAAMQVAQKQGATKEVDLARVKMAMNAIGEQALEKYRLPIAKHEFIPNPHFDANRLTREISGLRTKIAELGEVNLVAVKEYKELQERQQFMLGQKTEIDSAVALLEQGILEIEENSKEKFLGTFEKINQEFQGLFPILFPLGEARLLLSDPTIPLESGVEIMVQLPGKKTQSMRLFSGGEKALTAIALIFALLKSKPTPFCFLDEVDAPLDEKNIGRYNKVIAALSDRFQFIVITHRRPTMEVFDVLYGITMQEPGVSKVVGVDLNQALPHHLQKSFQLQVEPPRQGASAH